MCAPEFVTRFHVARRLGKHPKTVAALEKNEGLTPIRINGKVSYATEAVDALVARWKTAAARAAETRTAVACNRRVVPPAGWRLLVSGASGPFVGESIPLAPVLARELGVPEERIDPAAALASGRRIVSFELLEQAFRVAAAEGLNVITNARGVVAIHS